MGSRLGCSEQEDSERVHAGQGGGGIGVLQGIESGRQWRVTEAGVSEQGGSPPPPAGFLTPGSTTAAAAFSRSLKEPRRESTFRRTARISSIAARLMGKF